MTPQIFNMAIAFVLGSCIGSFLNVCIYRIPEGLSIAHPGSRCPKCENPIAFYDNIPIVSYLVLRARCRYCKTHIAMRYPFIELLTGLFAVASVSAFGFGLQGLAVFTFVATLITIAFIDLDHRIIPDVISLPGIPIFFLIAFALPAIGWQARLIGIVAGGGSLFAVAWGYQMITGREGMGGGDIKLLAMIGAMIGWQGVLFTLFAGSATGTLIGLVAMIGSGKGMRLAIPFGPFLATGAILYLFFGPGLIAWYFNLLRY